MSKSDALQAGCCRERNRIWQTVKLRTQFGLVMKSMTTITSSSRKKMRGFVVSRWDCTAWRLRDESSDWMAAKTAPWCSWESLWSDPWWLTLPYALPCDTQGSCTLDPAQCSPAMQAATWCTALGCEESWAGTRTTPFGRNPRHSPPETSPWCKHRRWGPLLARCPAWKTRNRCRRWQASCAWRSSARRLSWRTAQRRIHWSSSPLASPPHTRFAAPAVHENPGLHYVLPTFDGEHGFVNMSIEPQRKPVWRAVSTICFDCILRDYGIVVEICLILLAQCTVYIKQNYVVGPIIGKDLVILKRLWWARTG